MRFRAPSSCLIAWLGALGLIAAIVGAKGFIISRFGTDLPYMDQWVKEGAMIVAPFYEGTLRIGDFFVPHNEHRIAPTLALNLILTICGGQWDGRVQCVVNTFLHAALAVCIFAFAWRQFSRACALTVAWVLAGLCALPLAWENTLVGFQSQFYFFAGFSLGAICGLLAPRGAISTRWWVGLLCAVAASVSMGSGFLCLAPVVCILCLRLMTRRRLVWTDGVTAAVSMAFLIVGWCFRAKAPWHEPIHAHSIGDFLVYGMRCLAWPRPQWPWLSLWVWLPWFLFAARSLRSSGRSRDERSEALLAAGFWVLMQMAILAFTRGTRVGGPGVGIPAPRYGDIFLIGIAANVLTFFAWNRGRRWIHVATLGAWAAVVIGSALLTARPIWRDELPQLAAQFRESESNVRGYLLTKDPKFTETGRQPFPSGAWVRQVLDNPSLKAVMPASVRAPLPMAVDPSQGNGGFQSGNRSPRTAALENRDTWGSYGLVRPAEWRSSPISPTCFHSWRFEMAGQPATDNFLELETREGSPLLSHVEPTRVPGDKWRSAYVSLPHATGGIVVRARSGTASRWLAFSGPIEISRLSEAARLFSRQGRGVWCFGIALLFLATIAEIATNRRRGSGYCDKVASRPAGSTGSLRLFCKASIIRSRVLFWFLLALCGLILFARRPDAFSNPQFWAEDGYFFERNYTLGLRAIFLTYSGYLHLVPRLIAFASGSLDPHLIPGAYVCWTLLFTLYVAARTQSERSPLKAHPGFALAVVLVPDAFEVLLNPTNLQSILAVGLILILISAEARTTRQVIHDVFAMLLFGLTGPSIVIFAPLFIARALRQRSRINVSLAVLATVLAAVQLTMILTHPWLHANDALKPIAWNCVLPVIGARVGGSLFVGRFLPSPCPQSLVMTLGIGTFILIVYLALRPGPRRPERLMLAACFFGLVAAFLFRIRHMLPEMQQVGYGSRYLYAPQLIALWLVLELGISGGWRSRAAAGALALFVIVNGARLREPPLTDMHWQEWAERIKTGKAIVVPINPQGWTMTLPERRF